MRILSLCVFLAALTSLSACSAPASIGNAEKEIAEFHRHLDAEDYTAIWNASSEELKKAGPQDNFSKLLSAVHRKLGKVVQSKQVGWRSNVNTNGNFAEVQMDTRFEKGTGVESFVYRKDGEVLKLIGYNINSNELIIN